MLLFHLLWEQQISDSFWVMVFFLASPLRQVQSLNQCWVVYKNEGQIPIGYQAGYIYILPIDY